jgi:phosphatidylglycerol lysyltransferase
LSSPSVALVPPDPRARAFELVRQYGRDTVAFQSLETGFRYWFDRDDAVVAYYDTGSAWVAGGGPIAPAHRIAEVARAFVAAAGHQQRRACFFAAEHNLVGLGIPGIQIGEQPVWRAPEWDTVLRGAPSLRYQLNRARNKGVRVRRVLERELDRDSSLRLAIDELAKHWQATKRMAPMAFLVQLEPFAYTTERTLFVAERDGALLGLASAVPVYASNRLFVEDLLRSPGAANGTSELLIDAVMRAAADAGTPEVTLGLAPLAGGIARWLRLARWLGGPLYDFEGLRAFKAKLRPHAWEPIYLCTTGSKLLSLRDSLRAFAGGSLVSFAGRTLFRRRSS